VNHATDKAQHAPVLNPESFQRLLAAAYLLQEHIDRRPSIRAPLLGTSQASSFLAEKIIQKRTPAVMIRDRIRDRQLEAGQPDAIAGNQTARERSYLAGLVPFVRSAVPLRMTVLLRKPIYWRTVETVAIAIVFCLMTGLSILRLSAVPDRTFLASEALEKQDNLQPMRAGKRFRNCLRLSHLSTLTNRPAETRRVWSPKTSLSVTKKELSMYLASRAFG